MYTASTGLLNICSSVQAVAPPKCAAKASATSRLRVHTEVSFAPVTCLSPAAKRLAESPPPITPHVTTPGIPASIRRLFSAHLYSVACGPNQCRSTRIYSSVVGDTSRNGNLYTFAESRCNVLNCLSGQRQRIAPCPRTAHSLLRSC